MGKEREKREFESLLEILDVLREECPWDKKQTKESLRKLTIEETFELAEAIVNNDMSEIKKELGDLLLHIVFYSKIGEESGDFTIADVISDLITKLKYRHPHIFSDVEVKDEKEVLKNWEALKLKERGRKERGVLDGVPISLPAMTKAARIQEKVSGVGFDWKKREDVWDKVEEELGEVSEELKSNNSHNLEGEVGDLLFSIINASRLYGIDPEIALERTNRKFTKRFKYLEDNSDSISDLDFDEMNRLWEEAKKSDD